MSDHHCNRCHSSLKTCPTCHGKGSIHTGLLRGTRERCPNCKGLGRLCPKHGNDHG